MKRTGRDIETKRTQERKPAWRRLPYWTLIPVNREEFKFCCMLFGAAYDGKMPTPNPSRNSIFEIDDNSGESHELRLTDTPHNRAITAVREHFCETRHSNSDSEREREGDDFTAMAWRISAFSEFVRERLEKKDKRINKYVHLRDGEIARIEDAFVEAAALAQIGLCGQLKIHSMFAIAEARLGESKPSGDHLAAAPETGPLQPVFAF